jgi:hypothetical protein
MENPRTGIRYYVFMSSSSIVFVMFYWMDIMTASHHQIQMTIRDSVRMCWSHLRSSHIRVVNTGQMTSLLGHATPRSAIIPSTSRIRPDVPTVPVRSPDAAPVPVMPPSFIQTDVGVAPSTP